MGGDAGIGRAVKLVVANRNPMRRAVLALALASAARVTLAQGTTPLTVDPAVRTGTLPNGLRYIVRRNARPVHRAELRLVVNAGSVLEDDAQRGVAHFVEHMAFNGTRRFPKATIVNFLERIGMRFGADVNAYTSFDETVYQLQVPTDTVRFVDTGLDILEDWAHGIAFDQEEMRKERPVVIEEWRTGRDASTRISNKQFPVMLRGSRYADRIPIGTVENLETFPDSLGPAFYRDWYRPELMTVVAVGDFDPQAMIAKIRERFARIPRRPKARPRPDVPVPDHAEPLASIEADKEYPGKDITLLWLRPRTDVRTVAELRRALVTRLHDALLNLRFGELTQRADAPFAYATGIRGPIVRTKGAYQLSAGVKENAFLPAAEALLVEVERARRFGFTATELARLKADYLRALDQAYAERDKSESSGFAESYVTMALTGEPVIGIEKETALGRSLIPGITLAEVNAVAARALPDSNRVILVAGPDGPGTTLPTAAEVLAVFDRARQAPVAAYVDSVSDAPLVPAPPTPGTIVAEKTLPETNIREWTLSNGAKVLLKPTDFKADEVLFAARSPGGSSLASDADALDASFGAFAISDGGLGAFTPTTLRKRLSGIRAFVSPSVGSWSEHLTGSASRRDLATLFQLAWLRFTAPRVDSASWRAYIASVRAAQLNSDNDPETVFGDTVSATLSQHHPRQRLFRAAVLDSVNLGHALALYRERFAGADDFTFYLVGSFDVDSVRPLVARWLASLPSAGRHEQARDLGVRPPPGVVEKVVRKGIEPKAQTEFVFHTACKYSLESRVILDALRDLLDIRLREVLREDKGGTYGVGVDGGCSHIPYERARVTISWGSAPERRDELVAAMWAVIDSIKAGVVSDSNLVKIREMAVRAHETALRENGAWISAMQDADEDGRDQRDWLREPAMTAKVTREQLRDAAREYLRRDSVAQFVLVPETTPPKPVPHE